MNGSSRYYDDDCGLYYCIEDGSLYLGDCPLECGTDPCTCAEEQNCRDGACQIYGCDQCQDGFLKNAYSYHCVDRQECAGDDCLHCTDFLVCIKQTPLSILKRDKTSVTYLIEFILLT